MRPRGLDMAGLLRAIFSEVDLNQTEKAIKPIAFDRSQAPQFFATILAGHSRGKTRFACLALQGAFLLNTGAGIAAFNEMSKGFWPLIFCAAGALCSVLAAGSAWKMQCWAHEMDAAKLVAMFPEACDAMSYMNILAAAKAGRRWRRLGVGAWLSSIVLFCVALCAAVVWP